MRGERSGVVGIDPGQLFDSCAGQSCAVNKVSIGGNRNDESVRYAKPGIDQPAQVQRFAADQSWRRVRRIQRQTVAAVCSREFLKLLFHPVSFTVLCMRPGQDHTTGPAQHLVPRSPATVLTTLVDFGILEGYLIAPFLPIRSISCHRKIHPGRRRWT